MNPERIRTLIDQLANADSRDQRAIVLVLDAFMVTTLEELRAAKERIDELEEDLRRHSHDWRAE